MKVNLYTSKGTRKGLLDIPTGFIDIKANPLFVEQALKVYEDRSHLGLARTKTRGEISLTTAKWYRQKGTGRARHGAQSAPIFVGGSKAHGPKGVKRQLSLNQKMRSKAKRVLLGLKAREGQVYVAQDMSKLKKTKEASNLIAKMDLKGKRVTISTSDENLKPIERVFGNLKDVSIIPFSTINAWDIYAGGNLILDIDVLPKSKATKVKKQPSKTTRKKIRK